MGNWGYKPLKQLNKKSLITTIYSHLSLLETKMLFLIYPTHLWNTTSSDNVSPISKLLG